MKGDTFVLVRRGHFYFVQQISMEVDNLYLFIDYLGKSIDSIFVA